MVRSKKEMNTELREHMRGGEGIVSITHLVEKEQLHNCRLMSSIEIPIGASIGQHTHENETEYYIIMEGEGKVLEADGEKTVGSGDVVVTGHGESHSIRNAGSTPLFMVAIIITH